MSRLPFTHLTRFRRSLLNGVSQTSGILIIAIVGMVLMMLGGFALLADKQTEMAAVREQARQMRLARQSVMEMDNAFLHAVVQQKDRNNSIAFERSYDSLLARAPSGYPARVPSDGGAVTGEEAISDLVARLSPAIDQIREGHWNEAARLYNEADLPRRFAHLTRAFATELERVEAVYTAKLNGIYFCLHGLLFLQIVTGLLSVLAFVYAMRKSDREARARTVAVVAANETRDQVERLFDMADMLQSASDYSDANAVLRSAASELLFGFSGALYVFNNSRDRLILSTTWDRDGFELPPESLGLHQCWALKRGKPHINRPHSRKLCCEHHTVSDYALEIPMMARGEILGLLQVYAAGDEAEQRLIAAQGLAAAIADAMSLALANIALRDKLRSQALRDPLTGLYNRRYMEDTLQRFVRLAEREQREFSVVMIDLDHFKRLNDQHGYSKGDSVLRDVAAAIVSQLRETDVACRYGGEELMILLPDCSIDVAACKAESIRSSIEALSEPNGAKISASIGVAGIPSTSKTAKDLLANADAALYDAKQAGRNRVVRATLRKTAGRPRERAVAETASTLVAAE